ncbi:hypothetical protein D3C87_2166180 [compost metagenome]
MSELLEADRVRRGFLGALSADLRHQLARIHEAIGGIESTAPGVAGAIEALEHAERLAEFLERGIRD